MTALLTPDTISRQYPPKKILYSDKRWPIEIRPYNPEDLYAVQAAIDASLPELHRFLNWSHLPRTDETQMDFMLNSINNYWAGNQYIMGVFHAETQEFLMGTGYHVNNRINPLALEIGYWTVTKHSGQGLATLITKILIIFGFQCFRANRIEINCHPKNTPSLKVIEKCGFLQEGTLRHYLPPGTPKMKKAGYVGGEDMKLFSLTPGDISRLHWYAALLSQVRAITLLGKTVSLEG